MITPQIVSKVVKKVVDGSQFYIELVSGWRGGVKGCCLIRLYASQLSITNLMNFGATEHKFETSRLRLVEIDIAPSAKISVSIRLCDASKVLGSKLVTGGLDYSSDYYRKPVKLQAEISPQVIEQLLGSMINSTAHGLSALLASSALRGDLDFCEDVKFYEEDPRNMNKSVKLKLRQLICAWIEMNSGGFLLLKKNVGRTYDH